MVAAIGIARLSPCAYQHFGARGQCRRLSAKPVSIDPGHRHVSDREDILVKSAGIRRHGHGEALPDQTHQRNDSCGIRRSQRGNEHSVAVVAVFDVQRLPVTPILRRACRGIDRPDTSYGPGTAG